MDVKRLNFSGTPDAGGDSELSEIARRLVGLRLAPATSITVSRRRPAGWHRTTAAAGWMGSGPATPNTPYDLASLTKPVVAITAAKLASKRFLRLTDPIGKWLLELQHLPLAEASIEQTLSHRAGLLGHRVLFTRLLEGRAILRQPMLFAAARSLRADVRSVESKCTPCPVYSDLGYLVLGEVLERATGIALDDLVSEVGLESIGAPIASSRRWLARHRDFQRVVAPTEFVAWRGGTLRGVVHDENAWTWAGYGIAGHAGLFGTSLAVALFGEAVIDALAGRASPIPSFAALVCTSQREGGSLRAGFDGVSQCRSSAGTQMSRLAFGHLGFTGTSLWCDPENEFVFVMLTNRVNPTRHDSRFPNARGELHDQLFAWAAKNRQTL